MNIDYMPHSLWLVEHQNRISRYLGLAWQEREFPKSKQTIDSLLESNEFLKPIDLVQNCSAQTGPVGIISIPSTGQNVKSLCAALEKAKKEEQFFPDSLFFDNNGVIQFCGFVSNASGLNVVRSRILRVLYDSEIEIDPTSLRMTCIDYESARELSSSLYGSSLLGLALGANNSATHFSDATLSSNEPLSNTNLREELDLFNSLLPGMLGNKIRVVYSKLKDNDYVAFNRREGNSCEMVVKTDLKNWIELKDESNLPNHLKELQTSSVAYDWFQDRGSLGAASSYDVSWLAQKEGFVVVSLDPSEFEYDCDADQIYRK